MELQTASPHLLAEPDGSQLLAPSMPPEETRTLRQVFEAEESPLLRYAYGLVGQRETAEDLVQEAFVRLHAHWDEVANARAWLFRTIHNLALNHLRDHQRECPLDSTQEWASNTPDPEQALGRLEAIGTLQLLIAELPSADRKLIRLKYHQKLKYDQISQCTGLSVGNVGYKLHHLLKHLADSLRHLGIESAEG
ncbi:MAG: RNA polymerase sigma factor [Verrucomicrobiota bacterium]